MHLKEHSRSSIRKLSVHLTTRQDLHKQCTACLTREQIGHQLTIGLVGIDIRIEGLYLYRRKSIFITIFVLWASIPIILVCTLSSQAELLTAQAAQQHAIALLPFVFVLDGPLVS